MAYHDPFAPERSQPPAGPAPLGVLATDPTLSRRQSRLALALSVVPLLVTQIAAITLSVLVLAERDTQDRRKPVAAAAAGISSAWLVALIVALLLPSLASDDSSDEPIEQAAVWNEDGTLERAGAARLDHVRVGDCFNANGPVDAATGTPEGVILRPCDTLHDNEAFHVFALADGAYPAREELLRRARGGCQAAFGAWVGIPYGDSELVYDFFLPPESGWPADRLITCYIRDLDGSSAGTTQGSAR